MEMQCYIKIPYVSYKDHVTGEEVCANVQQAIGPHKDLIMVASDSGIGMLHVIGSGQNHLARLSEKG